jgi:hypothetical protein
VTVSEVKPKTINLVYEAFDALGGNASEKDVIAWVRENRGADISQYTGISPARARWKVKAGAPKKGRPARAKMGTKVSAEKSYANGHGRFATAAEKSVCGVADVIRLTRQAINAAGGKDQLKLVVDAL